MESWTIVRAFVGYHTSEWILSKISQAAASCRGDYSTYMDAAKKGPYQLLSLYTGSMIELKERQDNREQGAYCIQIWGEAFILGAYSCFAIDALRFFKLATLPCELKASRYTDVVQQDQTWFGLCSEVRLKKMAWWLPYLASLDLMNIIKPVSFPSMTTKSGFSVAKYYYIAASKYPLWEDPMRKAEPQIGSVLMTSWPSSPVTWSRVRIMVALSFYARKRCPTRK